MSNAVQVQIPVVDERMWRSILAALDRQLTEGGHSDEMRELALSKARAVFDRCSLGGPITISVPGEAEGIATWLSEFADNFRPIIVSLVLEIVSLEMQLSVLDQLPLNLKGVQP